jgi:deoxyribonuclease-2
MLCFILFLTTTFAFQCMNDVGKPVDSWVILKKPQGTTYFYYDSSEKDFKTSPYSLNDSSSGALTHTTQQLWLKDANYVLYNDQVPKAGEENDTATMQFGHTKGFFAFDNKEGFWLTHSIPLFPMGPQESSTYVGLGSNAKVYAQHLLCISVSGNTLNDLAGAFLLNRPQIYDSKLTPKANLLKNEKYSNIRNLIDGEFSTADSCQKTALMSQGGMPFTVYSKTAQWNNDLYAGCVAPYEKDTLWVDTWIRGKASGPVCPYTEYDTLDIKSLDFYPLDGAWRETQDHSKWLITEYKKVVCMGDVNRMTTQYLRGGGTACFNEPVLHAVLKKATTGLDTCWV